MTKAHPNCKACNGSGIRDIWVIDGWSATDCLCESGWAYDEMQGTWKEPHTPRQDEEERSDVEPSQSIRQMPDTKNNEPIK